MSHAFCIRDCLDILQLFGAGFPGPATLQRHGAARAGGADGAERAVHVGGRGHGQDGGE